MSVTVDFTTVTNAIAALSISGVTILDVHELPDTVGLDTHILAPIPNGFISNTVVSRDELSGQKLRLSYTLNYRFYLCALGSGGLFANYSGLVANAAAILLAFASDATLAGALDNDLPVIDNIGPVVDPSGKPFHGFDLSVRITQFLEV